MVNPGGTGSPMRHISARFAPLPPSSGFIVPLPSVFLPKRYTYFPAVFAFAAEAFGFRLWALGRADDCLRATVLAIAFAALLSDVHTDN
jgi:hypothetical protein